MLMIFLLLSLQDTQCLFVLPHSILSRIPDNVRIHIDNTNISTKKSLKKLGIYFDNHIQFDNYIKEISRKVYGALIFINRIKDELNLNARITVII